MSAPPRIDRPQPGARRRLTRTILSGLAAAVVVFAVIGARAISGGDTPSSGTAAPAAQAASPTAPATGAPASGAGRAAPPGFGTPVTGSTLTKLEAVATAKYPGTVERATKLSDGSYVVHVIKRDGSGEVHVLVSSALKVTGVETGPPAGATGAPASAGQAPPAGAPPSGDGTSADTQS